LLDIRSYLTPLGQASQFIAGVSNSNYIMATSKEKLLSGLQFIRKKAFAGRNLQARKIS
jgi:hypothetical protein